MARDVIERYLHNLCAVQPDFLYSVSRDFIMICQTRMLGPSDDVPSHPLQTSMDVASLAPNAEIQDGPVGGAGGAESAHDRPGAPFPQGASRYLPERNNLLILNLLIYLDRPASTPLGQSSA